MSILKFYVVFRQNLVAVYHKVRTFPEIIEPEDRPRSIWSTRNKCDRASRKANAGSLKGRPEYDEIGVFTAFKLASTIPTASGPLAVLA